MPDVSPTSAWPELPELRSWEDTRETLLRWAQVVGKVRLALDAPVNHSWGVAMYLSARGLTTSLMPTGGGGLEMELDLVHHVLELRTTDGELRQVALEPRTVADFHRATMAALDELGVRVEMLARPVEVVDATPFADDEHHRSYDPDAVHRFWLGLVQAEQVLRRFRAGFVGKASPVHFFWGAFDLATTRFSGRPAPVHPGGVPNCADHVMQEAYSHELSSCGFWPGGSDEGSFYAYAYPAPDGFAEQPVPEGARWDAALGEFVLPYRTVRTADDPDGLVQAFLQATYEAAADLAGWDRAALEAHPPTRT